MLGSKERSSFLNSYRHTENKFFYCYIWLSSEVYVMSLMEYIEGKLQFNINEINSWYMGYILSFTLNIESLCLMCCSVKTSYSKVLQILSKHRKFVKVIRNIQSSLLMNSFCWISIVGNNIARPQNG